MALLDTIKAGNQSVKIYSVKNRGNDFLKLSYFWAGEWKQKLLRRAGPQDDKRARAAARDLVSAMSQGRADQTDDFTKGVRTLRAAEDALSEIGVPVDLACREYAAAKTTLDGSGTILEAAEYFVRTKTRVEKQILLRDAVEKFIAAQESDGASGKYVQDIRARLRRFANENPGQLHELTTEQIRQWLRGLQVAPRTRNNFLNLIKTFLHWAKAENYLRRNVPTEADEIPQVAAPTEIHIHDADTVAKMFFGAIEHDPVCIPYLALGYFAGVRPKEMERMTGRNIRFEHNDIEVRSWQAKQTRRKSHRRLTPMRPNLGQWLTQFPVAEDERIANTRTRLRVTALRKRLGIPWHHDVMRHTAISNLVALTGNVDQVALWCGNSRDVIYASYLSQVTKREAKLFFQIAPEASKKIVSLAT